MLSLAVPACSLPAWIGSILFSLQEAELAKGASHKYIRRIPTGNPKRPYIYYYKVAGVGRHEDFEEGAKFRIKGKDGRHGHLEITGKTADGKLKARHDETGEEHELDARALTEMLHKEHAEALQTHRSKLARDIGAAREHGTPAQQAKLLAEAAKHEHTKDLGEPEKPKDVKPEPSKGTDDPHGIKHHQAMAEWHQKQADAHSAPGGEGKGGARHDDAAHAHQEAAHRHQLEAETLQGHLRRGTTPPGDSVAHGKRETARRTALAEAKSGEQPIEDYGEQTKGLKEAMPPSGGWTMSAQSRAMRDAPEGSKLITGGGLTYTRRSDNKWHKEGSPGIYHPSAILAGMLSDGGRLFVNPAGAAPKAAAPFVPYSAQEREALKETKGEIQVHSGVSEGFKVTGRIMGDFGLAKIGPTHRVIHIPSGRAAYVSSEKERAEAAFHQLAISGKHPSDFGDSPSRESLKVMQHIQGEADSADEAKLAEMNVPRTAARAEAQKKADALKAKRSESAPELEAAHRAAHPEVGARLVSVSHKQGDALIGKIELARAPTAKEYETTVDASIYGQYAVHASPLGEKGTYNITHVPSGMAAAQRISKERAHRLAQQLHQQLPKLEPGNGQHAKTALGILNAPWQGPLPSSPSSTFLQELTAYHANQAEHHRTNGTMPLERALEHPDFKGKDEARFELADHKHMIELHQAVVNQLVGKPTKEQLKNVDAMRDQIEIHGRHMLSKTT